MFALMNWPLGTPGTHKSVVCEPTETGHHFISSVGSEFAHCCEREDRR